MRYGIISDVHANLPALEAVLSRLKEAGVDAYLCLGDVVGYGAEPNECCERVRALECPALLGNHDAAVAGALPLGWFNEPAAAALVWTRRALSQANLDFLRRLPYQHRGEGFRAVHGSVLEPFTYLYEGELARASLEAIEEPLCFFGHTHIACAFLLVEETNQMEAVVFAEGGSLTLSPRIRYMVNPGSTGQPRDGNPEAACAIFDTELRQVEFIRTPYPIEQEQANMRQAGLPEVLIARLQVGY